jgi:hypothetical protein
MAEREIFPSLHNGNLTPTAIIAAPRGPSPARKTAPTPAPMTPHGYTLQLLISIIKNSRPRSPSRQNE